MWARVCTRNTKRQDVASVGLGSRGVTVDTGSCGAQHVTEAQHGAEAQHVHPPAADARPLPAADLRVIGTPADWVRAGPLLPVRELVLLSKSASASRLCTNPSIRGKCSPPLCC